ncbi:MAG: 3-dehydroquinate synthase [Treponema sp.]|nr:3-dehydroquinate synthase [Treponema sp.]
MTERAFTLNYPSSSGFNKTDIFFYEGEPDPAALLLLPARERRLFVTDSNVASLPAMHRFLEAFMQKKSFLPQNATLLAQHNADVLLVLKAGEAFKTVESVLSIVQTALEENMGRQDVFVAIGGGVVTDMTGFAASIFKRGVKSDFVPTTLLAMVDAAVGGKTGCDFCGYKNMVGSFSPARTLHVWPRFVQSLPESEYSSGLAEALKTALLFSPELWQVFSEQKDSVSARNSAVLEQTISGCVSAKAAIVQEDLLEHGRRAFLNFGHTFGHALEAVAGMGTISHGAAVAWGMGRALDLSVQKSFCTESYATETKAVLERYGYDMAPIPSVLSGIKKTEAAQRLLEAMRKDKKNKSGDAFRVVVQGGLCKTFITEVDDSAILKVLA